MGERRGERLFALVSTRPCSCSVLVLQDQRLGYALELLSEYVREERIRAVRSQLRLPEASGGGVGYAPSAVPGGPAAFEGDEGRDAKRPRLDPKEIARARAKVAREEKKAEDAKKAVKGMKSISSFFGGAKKK